MRRARSLLAAAVVLAFPACALLTDLSTLRSDASVDVAAPADVLVEPVDAMVEPCDAHPSTDPHNCGVCGHDCLGGACDDGACIAVEVYEAGTWDAGGLPPPPIDSELAIDGEYAYWTAANPATGAVTIYRAALADGGVTPVRSGTSLDAGIPTGSLAAAGGLLAWARFNGSSAVVECNPDDCGPGKEVVLSSGTRVLGASKIGVYFSGTGGVWYVAWTGGGSSLQFVYPPPYWPTSLPFEPFVESNLIDWPGTTDAGKSAMLVSFLDGTGLRVRSTIANDWPAPAAVAATDTALYWAPMGLSSVTVGLWAAALDGGGAHLVAPSPTYGVWRIRPSTNDVYFLGNGLERCPTQGDCVPAFVATSIANYDANDAYVVWLDAKGNLFRLVR